MRVIVTGANRGIGLEFCKQLSRKGYYVIALCRKKSAELENLNLSIIDNVDVQNEAILNDVKKQIKKPIDLLINNAGIYIRDDFKTMDYKDLLKQFEINSIAPLKVTRTFLSLLNKESKVIMITSQMGSIATASESRSYGYRASKAALNMFSTLLALELKPKKIAVGIFHPGYVQTDMTHHKGDISPQESVKGMLKLVTKLTLENSGSFWHVNESIIPW